MKKDLTLEGSSETSSNIAQDLLTKEMLITKGRKEINVDKIESLAHKIRAIVTHMINIMKEKKIRTRRSYEKPEIKSEKEAKELSLSCPTTSVKFCGTAFSPKKGA